MLLHQQDHTLRLPVVFLFLLDYTAMIIKE